MYGRGRSHSWCVMNGMPTVLALHPNEARTNDSYEIKYANKDTQAKDEALIEEWSRDDVLIG